MSKESEQIDLKTRTKQFALRVIRLQLLVDVFDVEDAASIPTIG